MIGQLLCLIGWHAYEQGEVVTWRIGDGHASRWRDSGVRDVAMRCRRHGCTACIKRREYRSKNARRRFERAKPPRWL